MRDRPQTARACRHLLRPARLFITDGPKSWTEETRGVIVSVNPLAEIVSRIPYRDRLDSGTLAVYAARERGFFTLFRLAASIFAGRARNDAAIGYHEAPSLTIGPSSRTAIRTTLSSPALAAATAS